MKTAVPFLVLALAGCGAFEGTVIEVDAKPYLQPDGSFAWNAMVEQALEAALGGTDVIGEPIQVGDKLHVPVESEAEEVGESVVGVIVESPWTWSTIALVLLAAGGVVVKRRGFKVVPEATKAEPTKE